MQQRFLNIEQDMSNILKIIFLYLKILKIVICAVESANITSKYVVYTAVEMVNMGNYFLSAGAIIKNDIIITNIALTNEDFRSIAKEAFEIDLNVFHFIVAGNIFYLTSPPRSNVYYAVDTKNIEYIAPDVNFITNRTKFFEDRQMMLQISLIRLKNRLPLDGITMDALSLPLQPHSGDMECFVSGWGNFNTTAQKKKIFETKVRTLNETECEKVIPEYKTTLCIMPVENINQCEIFNGGEPLICKDRLSGVVSEMNPCESRKPRPCADIFENRKWIQFQLDDLMIVEKSNQRQLKPIQKLFLYFQFLLYF